jgi:hypothetical protein
MKTSLVLLNTMLSLAKAYNPNDINEWQEKHTLSQQCDLIAKNLKDRGYVLISTNPLENKEIFYLKEESELVTDKGE